MLHYEAAIVIAWNTIHLLLVKGRIFKFQKNIAVSIEMLFHKFSINGVEIWRKSFSTVEKRHLPMGNWTSKKQKMEIFASEF